MSTEPEATPPERVWIDRYRNFESIGVTSCYPTPAIAAPDESIEYVRKDLFDTMRDALAKIADADWQPGRSLTVTSLQVIARRALAAIENGEQK